MINHERRQGRTIDQTDLSVDVGSVSGIGIDWFLFYRHSQITPRQHNWR